MGHISKDCQEPRHAIVHEIKEDKLANMEARLGNDLK
jgi:hypothetical protein